MVSELGASRGRRSGRWKASVAMAVLAIAVVPVSGTDPPSVAVSDTPSKAESPGTHPESHEHGMPLPPGVHPGRNWSPEELSARMRVRVGPRDPRKVEAGPETVNSDEPATAEAAPPAGRPADPTLTAHLQPSCTGTGQDGRRVKVLYAYPQGTTSRFSQLVPAIRSAAADVDDVMGLSARKTGLDRRVRWEHSFTADGGCVPNLTSVAVPLSVMRNVGSLNQHLQSVGFNNLNRKYLVFEDIPRGTDFCGEGQLWNDDTPVAGDNRNNVHPSYYGPSFARVVYDCWYTPGFSISAHEVMHTLGAVVDTAPYATSGYHCTDEWDVMCYDDDGGGPVTMQYVCGTSHTNRFDCRNDSYFSAKSPPAGAWLASHWNTANNSYLDRAVPKSGLWGAYYNNSDFTGTLVRRLDSTVNFEWTGSPVLNIAGDTFSTQWTGQLLAPNRTTTTYTIYGTSDNGMRIYIDGVLRLDDWISHTTRTRSFAVSLPYGKHSIRVLFREQTGTAVAKLSWAAPNIPRAIIPSTRLSTS